jgi:hypothetical protein
LGREGEREEAEEEAEAKAEAPDSWDRLARF